MSNNSHANCLELAKKLMEDDIATLQERYVLTVEALEEDLEYYEKVKKTYDSE